MSHERVPRYEQRQYGGSRSCVVLGLIDMGIPGCLTSKETFKARWFLALHQKIRSRRLSATPPHFPPYQ